jgi:hypothetical protein
MSSYIARTEKLAGKQLQYTLENLPPADSVGLFKVSFKTAESGATGGDGKPATPSAGAGRNAPGSGIVDEAGKAKAQPKAQPKRL